MRQDQLRLWTYSRHRWPVPDLNEFASPSWKPPSVESLPAWRVLRGIRWRRRLSQRELAQAASLPKSTIERIEARKVQPRYDTMLKILSACGYAIVVADAGRQYDPVTADTLDDTWRDAAERRLPAHLPKWLIHNEIEDPWWGWGRLAWSIKERNRDIPPYTFEGRPRRDWGARKRWNDAT